MPTGIRGRIFKDRVTLRFASVEKAELDEAVRISPMAYKGLSYFLRGACLDWARRTIASNPKGRKHRRRARAA